MLSVIITILKIIGILLLAIVALVFIVLALVLCVPFRYELNGEFADKKPDIRVRASWLFRFLCCRGGFDPEKKLWYRISILEIPLIRSDKKKEKISPISEEVLNSIPGEKRKDMPPETEKTEAEHADIEEKQEQKAAVEKAAVEKTSAEKTPAVPEERKTTEVKAANAAQKDEKLSKQEEKQRKKEEKQKKKKEKAEKKEASRKKREEWKEKLDDFLDMVQEPKNKEALYFLKDQLIRILAHLLPTCFEIKGRLGLSDPAATGKILGLVYAFYPIYGEHIKLVGEFEEVVIEGSLRIKGRIRLGTLLVHALRIILNSNIRKMLKKLKSLGGK